MIWRDTKLKSETSEAVTAVGLRRHRMFDLKAFPMSEGLKKIE